MNPFLQFFKEVLRNKLMLLMIGTATGVSTNESLPFLAKIIHPNKKSESELKILSAIKDRDALQVTKDSINKVIDDFPKQETLTKKEDEKVNRNVYTATDVQLDSILTNYRYIPFTKK